MYSSVEKETLLDFHSPSDAMTYKQQSRSCVWDRITWLYLLVILVFLSCLALFGVALYVLPTPPCWVPNDVSPFHLRFMRNVDNVSIRNVIKYYSSIPHIAGSTEDDQQAIYTNNLLKSYGFNSTIEKFDIMLTYPISRLVHLLEPITFNCSLKEPGFPIDNTSSNPNAIDTWNAWSAGGDVTGQLVYANYGTKDDYDAIAHINLTDKIVIVRYGNIFRANKVKTAEERGAIGVLIFTDSTIEHSGNKFYPDSPWGPNVTAQRGTVWTGNGDPTTPGWSSKACGNAKQPPRITLAEARAHDDLFAHVPRIPVQPISFDDAVPLLTHLGVNDIPNAKWAGPLGVKQIGPGPAVVRIKIDVNNTITPVWNVVGTITGEVEPDKVILIGCHRDAWTMGAGDPISGSAVLFETARGYGELLKSGWRPRRTIKVISWDAEEYGLMGSFEHLETWKTAIARQVVLYINTDVAVTGQERLHVEGSPSLRSVLKNISRMIEVRPGVTLESIWPQNQAMGMLGDGSDYAAFIQILGVPSLNLEFRNYTDAYGSVYHSNYDSFYWFSQFADPQFQHHVTLTKLHGMVGLAFADSPVLPFDYTYYGDVLQSGVAALANLTNQVQFAEMARAAQVFGETAKRVELKRQARSESKPRDVMLNRMMSDRLAAAESAFLGPPVLSGHQYYAHVLFSPAADDSYAASLFPAVINKIASGNFTEGQFIVDRITQIIYFAGEFLDAAYLN